ncbi:MAG: hypothetical protein L6Q52_01020 [Rhodocyclaceae bacterium]|nr:hypothetical protein [Rhodocyclaceae bacterium]
MKPLMLALPLLLAGCMNESATCYLDGREQSLTLQAKQPWFWEQRVELEVVMSHLPGCQRRSPLESAMPAEIALEVFRPEAGEFSEPILILRQGGRYYALGLANCELQAFKASPQKPGSLLGAFRMEGRQLKFKAAPSPAPQ